MIPTSHFRWLTDSIHKPPVLQQLWANLDGDEVLFYPVAYVEANGGEWRSIPLAVVGMTG